MELYSVCLIPWAKLGQVVTWKLTSGVLFSVVEDIIITSSSRTSEAARQNNFTLITVVLGGTSFSRFLKVSLLLIVSKTTSFEKRVYE